MCVYLSTMVPLPERDKIHTEEYTLTKLNPQLNSTGMYSTLDTYILNGTSHILFKVTIDGSIADNK